MDFTELPVAVQSRVLALAARSLTGATALQIPRELVAVARFAPARRARRGAAQLVKALEGDPAFRALVAHRAAGLDPNGVLAASTGSENPVHDEQQDEQQGEQQDESADDRPQPIHPAVADVDLMALAYLRAGDAPPGVLARLHATEQAGELRSRLAAAEAELGKLRATERKDAGGRAAHQGDEQDRGADGELVGRIERLTTRLREQGSRLREAQDTAERLQQEKDAAASEAARSIEILTRGRTAAEQRAAALAVQVSSLQAGEEAAAARQQHRARALTRRVELLLETAAGAVEGLRTEWTGDKELRRPTGRAAGASVEPAELVAQRLAGPGARRLPEIADTARLTEALGMPLAHLIVDGYNVSKTGFPHLTLAEQRERLVRALGVLAVRSGAEITVVFDGAAVVAPAGHQRGVRVLFSPAGTIADDVIRDLVDAEPAGRPLVVVTSDRAVMTDVGAAGARVAGSAVLLAALAR